MVTAGRPALSADPKRVCVCYIVCTLRVSVCALCVCIRGPRSALASLRVRRVLERACARRKKSFARTRPHTCGRRVRVRERARKACIACACTNGPGHTKRGADAQGNDSRRCRGTHRPAIPPHRDSQWSASRTRACGSSVVAYQPGHRVSGPHTIFAREGRKNRRKKSPDRKSLFSKRFLPGSRRLIENSATTCTVAHSLSHTHTHAHVSLSLCICGRIYL